MTDSINSWIIDSGATKHVCCSLQGFKETRTLEPGEFSFAWGNGATMSARSVGTVKLSFSFSKFLVCKNVYYVPDFGKNLLSVAQLFEQGFHLNFNNGIEIYMNSNLITTACLINNLYYIKPIFPTMYDTEVNTDLQRESKRIKIDSIDQTYRWHLRLDHIGLERIKRLVKEGPLEYLQVGSLPTCESCLEGKMTKRPFNAKGNRATECLELIHSDVRRPFNIRARRGYEYFVTFTDTILIMVMFTL